MAVAPADPSTTLHGLPPRRDPVPGRPRREQLARLVPAPQGRLRAAPQGADGAAVRRARGAVPGARHPAPRGPGEVAVPDLPRHAVLEGQDALQDRASRRASAGRATAARPRPAARTPRTSTRAAATSTSSRARSTSAAACGTPSRRGSTRSASGSSTDSTASSDRRGAVVRGHVRDGRRRRRVAQARAAGLPGRSPGRRPAAQEERDLRPPALRRRGDEPRAAGAHRGRFAAGTPLMRYLATVQ